MNMQGVGFVLFVIGIGILLLAKRIVMSRVKLDDADKKEIELLAQGAVIAVRITGFIVAVMGILFLMM